MKLAGKLFLSYIVVALIGLVSLSISTLAEFRAGLTLDEIAESQGIVLQSVYDAVPGRTETHLYTLVEAGRITQDQADARLALMQTHITEIRMQHGAKNAGTN